VHLSPSSFSHFCTFSIVCLRLTESAWSCPHSCRRSCTRRDCRDPTRIDSSCPHILRRQSGM